jgi:segregation and condensation protein B
MDQLAQHIESLVFVSDAPISFKEIKSCLDETFETKLKKPLLEEAIQTLKEKYQEDHFSFEFVEIAGGFQFLTKPAYHNSVGTLLRQNNKRRLSKAALETLSIIAYKQPVTKSEMEKIRGVSCDYSVQKLLEKELVAIMGRSEAPGRPLLYGTSDKFMNYFGLKDLDELPKPKDFKETDNEIGEQAPIDETATEVTPETDTATNPEE